MYKIYAHYLDDECIYVGCGNEKRPFDFIRRNQNWKRKTKGRRPIVVFLDEKETWKDALECEKYHIDRMTASGFELMNQPPGRYWLGKKRDTELMARITKLSHTPEANEKRSESMTGRTLTEEHKSKLGLKGELNPQFGKERSAEHCKNLSESRKGIPLGPMSEEHKAKISAATMGRRPLTEEEQARRLATWKARGGTTKKAKSLMCIESGTIYRSAKDAAEDLGLSDKHIQACCVGKRARHGKLTFKYVT